MSKRNDDLLIEDIISSCNKILNYTKDFSEETFIEDDKTIWTCRSHGISYWLI